MRTVLLVLAAILAIASADLYLHNPRGSNNRYRGDNNNQNRLFDSQNNANGGYAWGPEMSYYQGSLLQVEYTSQHGCGPDHPNVECEIIMQYMCGPWIQDGLQDGESPEPEEWEARPNKLDYGIHEPPSYYLDCKTRLRNRGLFIADQGVGNRATNTRQNDGNKRGYECDEERDYYPYWHPAPWRDIAILTSGPTLKRCPYYAANSQNTSPKHHCVDKTNPSYAPIVSGGVTPWDIQVVATHPLIWGAGLEHNNQADCELNGGLWATVPSWGLAAPECIPAPLSRDNHLGNADMSTTTATYKMVIPTPPYDDPAEMNPANMRSTCVFRIRYNISSLDYAPWAEVDGTGPMIDSQYNGQKSPVRNNPTVNFGIDANGAPRNLTLALDTSQFGRTFQDRSHRFYIIPRPSGVLPSAKIINLNVRGRRGNIVQAYPACEYDFVPTTLRVKQTDLIHIQWTGSNIQPGAGEGTANTDRHNLVQMKGNDRRFNYPWSWSGQEMFDDQVALRLAHLNQLDMPICTEATEAGCCLTGEQLLNDGNRNQNKQNCQKLNAASDYFNAGLVQLRSTGTFHYMSTRNNNFTNRSQKGTIVVETLVPAVALAGIVAGSAGFIGAAVVAGGVWYAKRVPTSAGANIFGGLKI